MIRGVQNRRSPPRGSLRLRRRDDVPMRQVKEEPEYVKPPVLPAGYEVPPALHDEAHDGDIPGLSFALVASVSEIERDPPDRGALGADGGLGLHLTGASRRRAHLPRRFVLHPHPPRRQRRHLRLVRQFRVDLGLV